MRIRKTGSVGLLPLILFSFIVHASNSLAASTDPSVIAQNDYGTGVSKKLGRGLSNVAFGWLDFLKGIESVGEENNALAAVTWGPIYGAGQAVTRTLVGAYEVVTFPFPGQPIVEPEFVMDNN